MALLTLYYYSRSAHCRLVLQVIRILGLEVDIKVVDLVKKEQLNEDFIKINPSHTVPTLVDDGFVLTESRAIIVYLVEKYAPGNSLYPEDIKTKALINQRMQFDVGNFYQRLRAICFPVIYLGQTTINDEHRQKLFESIGFLNTFLDGHKYVAGTDHPTLADISLFGSVANLYEIDVDFSPYPNISAWYERCKTITGSDENLEGAKSFGALVKSVLKEKL